jgi:hypothetical protein
MRTFRSSRLALAAVSLAAVATLSACGGSSDTEEAAVDSSEVVVEEEGEEVPVGGGGGEMADVNVTVTSYLDAIWPIEGNTTGDAATAQGWCAEYTVDSAATVASVEAYLADKPDIAAADPMSVSAAIDEYLTNNCYLIEE